MVSNRIIKSPGRLWTKRLMDSNWERHNGAHCIAKQIHVVALDFDGVITRPQERKAEVLSSMGYDIPPDMTSGLVSMRLILQQRPELGTGGAKEEYIRMIRRLYIDDMLSVPPETDAVECINDLVNDGRHILPVVVTSRDSSDENPEMQAALRWLDYHSIPIDTGISTAGTSKKSTLVSLEPILFGDDSVSKLNELFEDYADTGRCEILPSPLDHTEMYLFRNAANAGEEHIGRIKEVNGWTELYGVIDALL